MDVALYQTNILLYYYYCCYRCRLNASLSSILQSEIVCDCFCSTDPLVVASVGGSYDQEQMT